MQKLDYVERLRMLQTAFKTDRFLSFFDDSLAKATTPVDFNSLIPDLFDSKSQYEILKSDEANFQILDTLGAAEIFESRNLTWLTTLFKQVSLSNLLSEDSALDFFIFHKSINSINKLNEMLFNLEKIENDETDTGVAIFRVIESDDQSIDKMIKIFKAIEELTNTLMRIYDEEEDKIKLYLLDSGSDTNVGITTSVKVAKSLYLIFKEVWDSIINRKYYRHEKDNQALINSLTIRAELRKRRDQGLISEEEEKLYAHSIKTKVDSLLQLNVITKDLYDKSPHKETIRFALDSNRIKQLNESNPLIGDDIN